MAFAAYGQCPGTLKDTVVWRGTLELMSMPAFNTSLFVHQILESESDGDT